MARTNLEKICLTEKEEKGLEEFFLKKNSKSLSANIIMHLARTNHTHDFLSKILGINKTTVTKTKSKFLKHRLGMFYLPRKKGSGRPRKIFNS